MPYADQDFRVSATNRTPHHFARRDTGLAGRWWWSIDRINLFMLLSLMCLGVLMSFAASPAVAQRLRLDHFFFVKRHVMMLVPTVAVMLITSLFSLRSIRRLSVAIYIFGFILLIWTLWDGVDIKGARRWLMIGGMSLQASEFGKPAVAVLSAWLLSTQHKDPKFPGLLASAVLLGILLSLLLMQPDLGMSLVLTSTWIVQLFIAGMPMRWMAVMGGMGVGGFVLAYLFLPHVTKRVDQFFDAGTADPHNELYQITKSLQAFHRGGLFGTGPGEGIVKHQVPDAHADFVFAVTGEEFGLMGCLLLVMLFAVFISRNLRHAFRETNMFTVLAISGLTLQLALQAFVNIASTLHLIPTKGMTLPFVSYGGSSMIALGILAGMLLSLTRKRPGAYRE